MATKLDMKEASRKMLDLLVVNPNNRIVSPFAAIEPPLWAGLIASHYKEQGQKVAMLDAEAGNLTIEQTIEAIKNTSPRMIIIVVMGNNPSVASTPKMLVTKKLIGQLNNYKAKTTVAGLHPSALPVETEFELGVPVLKGKIFEGTPDMPWELLPMDKYRAHNWHCLDESPRSPYGVVYTSLGCPFDCSFCNIHALYGGSHKVWYRNPEAVVSEIDLLVKKYKVRNIKFWDELFTLNQEHIEEICNRLIWKQYDLNIWAYARVDTINSEKLVRMKQAGINWLAYGFESGSDNILAMSNKKASKDKAIKAVCVTHDVGINIIGNFVFGLPGDTGKTMQETLDFAKSLKLEFANFYVAKTYPGSNIYKGNKDWASYSQFGEDDSKTNKFRDKAFIEFFTDRDYLDRIENRFGKQAIGHIKTMLEFGKPTAVGEK